MNETLYMRISTQNIACSQRERQTDRQTDRQKRKLNDVSFSYQLDNHVEIVCAYMYVCHVVWCDVVVVVVVVL